LSRGEHILPAAAYVNGESKPKMVTLHNLSEVLGVRLYDLAVPVSIPKAIRFRASKKMKIRDQIVLDAAPEALSVDKFTTCILSHYGLTNHIICPNKILFLTGWLNW
jgi:hypothetical protein